MYMELQTVHTVFPTVLTLHTVFPTVLAVQVMFQTVLTATITVFSLQPSWLHTYWLLPVPY